MEKLQMIEAFELSLSKKGEKKNFVQKETNKSLLSIALFVLNWKKQEWNNNNRKKL